MALTQTSAVGKKFEVKIIKSQEEYNADIKYKSNIAPKTFKDPAIVWQTSSKNWLSKHSLKAMHLDAKTIFPQLGFLHLQEFDDLLKKTVESKYGESLFLRHQREDGKIMNIIAKRDVIVQLGERLQNAVETYKNRLEWLQSGSRRMFGIIQERIVTILIDIRTMSPREFDQCICLLEKVVREQLRHVAMFNLIRCCENPICFDTEPVGVTSDTIQFAIDWLWNLDRLAPTGVTNTIEGVLKASLCKKTEAIYLFSENESSNHSREILLEQVKKLKVPLHIVLYNCANSDWTTYLKSMCDFTGARFHAYNVAMSIESYEGLPVDHESQRADIIVKKRLYGGAAPGSGIKKDSVLIFEELENARNLLDQVNFLIKQIPEVKPPYENHFMDVKVVHERQEESMSSKEWLAKYGLLCRKLDFFHVLKGVVFRHCDGVVNMSYPPNEDDLEAANWNEQLNAVREPKLVNAKYCDKFAHVRWKDGTIVHVQVTADIYRLYEQRMQVALGAIRRRIEWLKQGSRELFGTIMEEQVYILFDTSSSMQPSIVTLKDKLYILLQEQLRHKRLFNFVAFNNKAHPWKDRLEEVTENNLKAAWHWIRLQQCAGSTNTLAALKFAIGDPKTEGIYLLTDGRPNQQTKTILAQLHFHKKIPIHSISFNCADEEANAFLLKLARETGGRFHLYDDVAREDNGISEYESEDIRLLKEEYTLGCESLEKMAKLRDECFRLAWNKSTHEMPSKTAPHHQRNGKDATPTNSARKSLSHNEDSHSRKPLNRPKMRNNLKKELEERSRRKKSRDGKIFGTLNKKDSKASSESWILPESKELLIKQEERYKQVVKGQENTSNEIDNPDNQNNSNVQALADFISSNSEADQIPESESKKVKSSQLSLRQWIHINSIKRKKLTIYDALGPCKLTKVDGQYIPLLEKQVESQVFEEIMPVRYYKNGKTIIVNPLSVNWKEYREKIEKLVKRYIQKWIDEIRLNVDTMELERVLNETADTLDFNKHHEIILNAIDDFDWPLDELAMTKLTDEINKGTKYINESLLLEENKATKAGGFSPQKKSSSRGRNPLSPSVLLNGKRVIVPSEKDGLYYEAYIDYCPTLTTAEVFLIQNEKSMLVPLNKCIEMNESSQKVKNGDFILVRSYFVDKESICYLPATVTDQRKFIERSNEKVKVKLFTEVEHAADKKDLVKIKESLFHSAVAAIIEKNVEKKKEKDVKVIKITNKETKKRRGSSSTSSSSINQRNKLSNEESQRVSSVLKKRISELEEKLNQMEANTRKQIETLERSQQQEAETNNEQFDSNNKDEEIQRLKNKVEELDYAVREMEEKRQEELENRRRKNSTSSASSSSSSSSQASKELESLGETISQVDSPLKRPESPDWLIGRKVVAEVGKTLQFNYGIVIKSEKDGSVIVRDPKGIEFRTASESVFAETLVNQKQDLINDTAMLIGCPVLAERVKQSNAYFPAIIVNLLANDDLIKIRFCDGFEMELATSQLYQMTKMEFETIVNRMRDHEDSLLGTKVIARDDQSGIFMQGTILSRDSQSENRYNILLANGQVLLQKSLHIFRYGLLLKIPLEGERVLARFDKKTIFLPGWILHYHESAMSCTVHFFHGKEQAVAVQDVVTISTEYYNLLLQHMIGQGEIS